jgi:DNA-binding response OmpR family regulator
MRNLNVEERRILFVETDPDSCGLVSLQLRVFKLVFAHGFDEAIRLAQCRYFDLYMLGDLRPDGASVDLCRRIRAFDPCTPILFYSAWADQRHQDKAFVAGAQAYLTKPVYSEKLIQAIAQTSAVVAQTAHGARRAEIAAIREELATRQIGTALRMKESKRKAARAGEKLLRLKAHQAYLASGGTRGDFARQWASGFLNQLNENGD